MSSLMKYQKWGGRINRMIREMAHERIGGGGWSKRSELRWSLYGSIKNKTTTQGIAFVVGLGLWIYEFVLVPLGCSDGIDAEFYFFRGGWNQNFYNIESFHFSFSFFIETSQDILTILVKMKKAPMSDGECRPDVLRWLNNHVFKRELEHRNTRVKTLVLRCSS